MSALSADGEAQRAGVLHLHLEVGLRTSNCDIDLISSIPSSTMSNTRPSNILVKTRSCGRFFECRPVKNKLASFLFEKNSRDEASSNGWISFLRENEMAWGRLREYCGVDQQ